MSPFDLGRIQSAARRYQARETIDSNRPTKSLIAAAPKAGDEKTARRMEWLAAGMTRERALASVREADARGVARDPRETIASLSVERIIGSNDLRDVNYLELAVAVARAVCRIRVGSSYGSGFLVGPGLLMTNHHVIESPDDARMAEAQFDYQENASGELLPVHAYRLEPDVFFLTDSALDFTLVSTSPVSSKGQAIDRYPWLQLIGALGKAVTGDPLNVIQHPQGGLKQIALRNNTIIDIPDGNSDFLYYTTDTQPGSSGSPCLNDQWELVALHHSGVPKIVDNEIRQRDGAVWRDGIDDPALIDWIANEGVRVSAMVKAIRDADLQESAAEQRDRMLNDTPPNPVELARSAGPGIMSKDRQVSVGTGQGSVSFSVPLTISISIGAVQSGSSVPVVSVSTDQVRPGSGAEPSDALDAAEALKVDPDWHGRKGYDPDFLGVRIPLPTLSAAMRKHTVEVPVQFRNNGDKYELAYHHFSLAMNRTRRFAWYSVANIDGDRRPRLPDRKDDKWNVDPRIDDPNSPKIQCGEELYAAAKTDRGHLTRYLDVAWGNTKGEALKALADTFHFTNCCLQLSAFNQGKDRWQGIEQFLLEKKAKKEKRRIIVVTGPLFHGKDPFYQNPSMDYRVRIPLDFWKICAIVRPDDSLSATGFILSQEDIASLPGFEEALDVAAVQVTVAQIENQTGMKFPILRDNDHLGSGGSTGTLEIEQPSGEKGLVKPIRTYDDIIV